MLWLNARRAQQHASSDSPPHRHLLPQEEKDRPLADAVNAVRSSSILSFGGPTPRWFSIPAHRPFVRDLAQGLFDALSPLGPDALSQAVVLTPTRRGARALADAFVTVGGGRAILPPQIRPLGDLDEGEPPFEPGDIALDLPVAISPLRRRFELVRLVKLHERALDRDLDAAAALELADALGLFLDSLQIEEVSPGKGLADLVDADLAEHWRVSREFLDMALVDWPLRLAELGVIDVGARRVRLLQALAAQWSQAPPQGVLIAAGSTGTAPATARLLRVIAEAPQGAVVLPGLDEDLKLRAWLDVDDQHPQGAMKRLLAAAGVDREAVKPWPASPVEGSGNCRRRVINEALRPAKRTADWLDVITEMDAGDKGLTEGFKGLSLIAAQSEDEAATVAALLLRETLETPDLTAALVTPDQTLARRVAAKLSRWGIVADTSAGADLSGQACGVLAGLVAKAAASPLDPVVMLAVLKHPMVRLGLAPTDLAVQCGGLERHGLRGPRRSDWWALEAVIKAKAEKAKEDPAAALDLLALYRTALAPAIAAADGAPSRAAMGLATSLEALARDAGGNLGGLWSGPAGEGLAKLIHGLIHESGGLPDTSPRAFAELFQRLMDGETVRIGGATHSRLHILGAIEARLTRADRLIVAGLEEGVWPQGAPVDPFLSRGMRKALGLPPPERRVGLAAHDFAQAACAPDVILLYSERRDGAPAVKSRWLWRLETLAKGANVTIPARPEVLAWARGLDAAQDYQPAKRPAPVPPLAHRPRRMAVTRIEALTRDPYAVWARDILQLYRLNRPDEPVDARARGTAIHSAFERFVLDNPLALPDNAAERFQHLYLQALELEGVPHEALAREGALAKEAADWVVDLERERRADGRTIHVEQSGKLTFPLPGGAFTVTAKADRIEITPDGLGHILDYKTGSPPSAKQVSTGFSPQLTLTAAILARGGFEGLGRPSPGDLSYIQVTGRVPAGKLETRAGAGEESEAAAAAALQGLKALITVYDDPAHPYLSRTAPQFVKDHPGDYGHLARVSEWCSAGEEGDEG